jgi:hypothetical protein
MLRIENSPEGLATAAVGHLIVGLMKCDGKVSLREEIRMDDLVVRLARQLPSRPEATSDFVTALLVDVDYQDWQPMHHLDRGLEYFGQLVDLGEALHRHADAVIEVLRQLMEVDDVTASERDYLAHASQALEQRFG